MVEHFWLLGLCVYRQQMFLSLMIFSQEIANNPSAQAFLGPEDAEVSVTKIPVSSLFKNANLLNDCVCLDVLGALPWRN